MIKHNTNYSNLLKKNTYNRFIIELIMLSI
nr:MAG TPA: hypothetical protein [Microviridae sp.]